MDSLDNSQNQAQTAKQNNQGQSNLATDIDANTTNDASAGDTSSLSSDDTSTEDILNKDILELMGAKNMPEEKKQELYQKMMETVQNRVIGKVADMLEGENLEKFKELAQAQKKLELEEFLKSQGINLSKVMLQEALFYKTEMAELSKTIQQAAQK